MELPKLEVRGSFKTRKLCPPYVGPFQILRLVGSIVYQ